MDKRLSSVQNDRMNPDLHSDPGRGPAFLKTALIFYGLMGAGGYLWLQIARGTSVFQLIPPGGRPRIGVEFLLLTAALLLNILFDWAGPRYFSLLRRFQRSLRLVIGPLGTSEILILAILSSLGEEILFRGALQPTLGFLPAALLFALSHFPIKKELWIWPFYALFMGIILGFLRLIGGDIWSAVLLHFGVNAVSLYLLSGKKTN